MMVGSMSRLPPSSHQGTNGPACDETRKRRCSLTIWFDPMMARAARSFKPAIVVK